MIKSFFSFLYNMKDDITYIFENYDFISNVVFGILALMAFLAFPVMFIFWTIGKLIISITRRWL